MALWVFGYGSLIWKAGFHYDEHLVGFVKEYRRVFYQGSTDHRGTPEFPGRTVTLEPAKEEIYQWGAAYKITNKEDQLTALEYLEVREKQYDEKAYVDFFTEPTASVPAVSDVLVYIASADKKLNMNYLGPASLEEMALYEKQLSLQHVINRTRSLFGFSYCLRLLCRQIIKAQGPSGPNRDYLFKLENALFVQIGFEDKHVTDLANEVRRVLLQGESAV
ncbi:Gamma-glutamylcyclotransferase 2-3 [Orobanche minor]